MISHNLERSCIDPCSSWLLLILVFIVLLVAFDCIPFAESFVVCMIIVIHDWYNDMCLGSDPQQYDEKFLCQYKSRPSSYSIKQQHRWWRCRTFRKHSISTSSSRYRQSQRRHDVGYYQNNFAKRIWHERCSSVLVASWSWKGGLHMYGLVWSLSMAQQTTSTTTRWCSQLKRTCIYIFACAQGNGDMGELFEQWNWFSIYIHLNSLLCRILQNTPIRLWGRGTPIHVDKWSSSLLCRQVYVLNKARVCHHGGSWCFNAKRISIHEPWKVPVAPP